MTTLTLDEAMLLMLRQTKGLTEIRDVNGVVVGFFAPVSIDRAHQYAEAAAQVDPLETRRRMEAGGKFHTTQDVLNHLGSLETL